MAPGRRDGIPKWPLAYPESPRRGHPPATGGSGLVPIPTQPDGRPAQQDRNDQAAPEAGAQKQGRGVEHGLGRAIGQKRVTYDLERPVGERVNEVLIGGRALAPDATYTVTTFDFLAAGADLYRGFTEARVVSDDGPEFAELLEARFASGDAVSPPPRGRLIPVG